MLQFQFDPFPEITTNRLHLRRVTAADAEALFQLRSDPVTMQYIDRPLAKELADAENLAGLIEKMVLQNTGIAWAITWKDNPRMIGTIGFHRLEPQNYRAEIGYMLLPGEHRKGIMHEAMGAVIRMAFESFGLHSIEAHVNPDNAASIALLEKNGFVREAYFRENYFYAGKFLDTAIYSLLKSKAV